MRPSQNGDGRARGHSAGRCRGVRGGGGSHCIRSGLVLLQLRSVECRLLLRRDGRRHAASEGRLARELLLRWRRRWVVHPVAPVRCLRSRFLALRFRGSLCGCIVVDGVVVHLRLCELPLLLLLVLLLTPELLLQSALLLHLEQVLLLELMLLVLSPCKRLRLLYGQRLDAQRLGVRLRLGVGQPLLVLAGLLHLQHV